MGYRDRQAHKQQQKQQQFSGAQTGSTQRVTLPAPKTMNLRDSPNEMPPTHAPVIENAYWHNGALKIINLFRPEAILTSTSADSQISGLISYNGSGSSSSEFWAFVGGAPGRIHNLKESIPLNTSVSASTSAIDTLNVAGGAYDYTIFNNTVICVSGVGTQLKWTRASAWDYWSATCSGASIGILKGIDQFKSRLIGWELDNTKFWYSSVDQVLGTMNSFDLGGIINAPINTFFTLSKDGGAGPDDYACFVSYDGEVAMYAGTDPGDANAWSLVGVFKTGRPISRNAHINYGNQTVVLCEDDFYFLPEDFSGKKSSTLGVDVRDLDNRTLQSTGAVYNAKHGAIIFSDGSLWSTKGGLSYSNISLSSANPWDRRQNNKFIYPNENRAIKAPFIENYNGETYTLSNPTSATPYIRLNRLFPPGEPNVRFGEDARQRWDTHIRTAPINTQGRTNITLVNPKFGMRDFASASTSAYGATRFLYRTGVLYDTAWQPQRDLNIDSTADFFVTTSTSANSYGKWTPGFGTGDEAQIIIEVLSGSADDQELLLHGIDLIIADTGGM